MTRGRHSLAPRASKPRRFALLAAPLVTCGIVGAGVVAMGASTPLASGEPDFASSALGDVSAAVVRESSVSRSLVRSPAPAAARAAAVVKPKVTDRLWTTDNLDLRLTPADQAKVDGQVDALKQIGVTGVRRDGFAQVIVAGEVRWVTAQYLAAKKPTDPAHLPLADTPCAGTSGVENGITPNAVRVYRAVCNNFPQITQYGGYDNHGEHSSGRAIDIMTSDVALGTAIADFLRANAGALNLFDVIWRQHIWTPERAAEGWRAMPDRGSATANHYNHVHVSVN